MARIRIVDEWLRSPVSSPSRHRAILVVAESWSEQRVLMRAFAASDDQTRPTIRLHGTELAIGPAGTDPHGQWGLHVEPPVDGRAQELRRQLELAARRLAGSKGRPPRLVDEEPAFDGAATSLWAPGSPADVPAAAQTVFGRPEDSYYEPAEVAPPSASTVIPSAAPRPAPPPAPAPAPRSAELRRTPPFWADLGPPRRRPRAKRPTARGFAPGSQHREPFASLVRQTMPIGLCLGDDERQVLNALGERAELSAPEIAALVGAPSGIAWMEALMSKLAEHGLELIAPGRDRDGEPTYVLRR